MAQPPPPQPHLPLLPLLLLLAAAPPLQSLTQLQVETLSISHAGSVQFAGRQVPIFRDLAANGRLLVPPLGLLLPPGEADDGCCRLEIRILLWTDEFRRLAQESLGGKSVELLPLRRLSLAASPPLAGCRLAVADADVEKLPMLATFVADCETADARRRLLRRLAAASPSQSPSPLRLRYVVAVDRRAVGAVRVSARHFNASADYRRLRADRRLDWTLTSATVARRMASGAFAEAAAELLESTKYQLVSPDSSRAAVAEILRRLLARPVADAADVADWSRVDWPPRLRAVRPDRLAVFLGLLWRPSGGQRRRPRRRLVPTPNASAVLRQLRDELPAPVVAELLDFGRRHPDGVGVVELQRLAASFGSGVAWNEAARRLVPADPRQLFLLDFKELEAGQPLTAEVQLLVAEETRETDVLPHSATSTASPSYQPAPAYQRHFADSFCVLANRRRPAGLHCSRMSFVLPTKSLRKSPLFDRRVRYHSGVAGDSHFRRLGDDFFSFRLSVCCTD